MRLVIKPENGDMEKFRYGGGENMSEKTRRNFYINDDIYDKIKKLSHKLSFQENEKITITDILHRALREYLIKHGYEIIQPKAEKAKKSEILQELNIGNNKYIFYDNGFVDFDDKHENYQKILEYFPENHIVREMCKELYCKS